MHACAWGSCHLCNSEPEWEPFPLASDAMRRGRCSALQVQDLNSGRRRGDELQLSREVYAHICKKNNKKKKIRTSRQTQTGIGHSAPAHRGGHVQNRSRRREDVYLVHREEFVFVLYVVPHLCGLGWL